MPFISGKIEIWSGAVIYALGQINCLFDSSFEPYVSAGDICNYFNTNQSTTSQRAKKIRDMFRIRYWDEEFATKRMKEGNPLKDLVMINGLIVDIKNLIPEILEENPEDHEEMHEKETEKKKRIYQKTLEDIN